MIDIFEFDSYKKYLVSLLKEKSKQGRGQRSALAKAVCCQTAYLSRVLSGEAHFSLEQGMAASHYLGHSKEERHFFLLLIQKNRAGTPSLQRYFDEQVELLRKQRANLRNRIPHKSLLHGHEQARYFSEWYFAAIHLLTSIPSYQNREAIASRLGLPSAIVSEALDFLMEVGFVKRQGTSYKMAKSHLHLGADSPFISQHHRNWRLEAMNNIRNKKSDSLHYSSVVSCSLEDSIKVRTLMINAIEEIRLIIGESKEEELFCYNLDFFEIPNPK